MKKEEHVITVKVNRAELFQLMSLVSNNMKFIERLPESDRNRENLEGLTDLLDSLTNALKDS